MSNKSQLFLVDVKSSEINRRCGIPAVTSVQLVRGTDFHLPSIVVLSSHELVLKQANTQMATQQESWNPNIGLPLFDGVLSIVTSYCMI